MVYVVIENEKVVGVFANPQPQLEGYAEIADDDPRIATFLAAQEAANKGGKVD